MCCLWPAGRNWLISVKVSRRLTQTVLPMSLYSEGTNKPQSLTVWNCQTCIWNLVLFWFCVLNRLHRVYIHHLAFRKEKVTFFFNKLHTVYFHRCLKHAFNAKPEFSKFSLLWSSWIYQECEGEFTEESLLTLCWTEVWRKASMDSKINWVLLKMKYGSLTC